MRLSAPGRVTNYEMESLREASPRRMRWAHVWQSLNEPFHPKSLAEWTLRNNEPDEPTLS